MTDQAPETAETPRERGRFIFRVVLPVAFLAVLMADVALYSMVQALSSRVEAQDHRLERLQKMVTDMIGANQNAEKIEKIETQVDGIETQVNELTTTLKKEAADAEEAKEAAAKKKKRRR
jgi:uncharacterized protein HemX